MLKVRILTALVVLPFFISAILFLPTWAFLIFAEGLVLGCAWEWSALVGDQSMFQRILYLLLVALASQGVLWLPMTMVRVIVVLFWLFAWLALLCFASKIKLGLQFPSVRALVGVLMLALFYFALVDLRAASYGPKIIMMGFILIWLVDSGAYFFGRAFGHKKLMPSVSPNKTWVGVFGGVSVALMAVVLCALIMQVAPSMWACYLSAALCVAIAAVVGDLFESLIKRLAEVKDSGTLLPGHGGLLDRFDSAFAALPVLLVIVHGCI